MKTSLIYLINSPDFSVCFSADSITIPFIILFIQNRVKYTNDFSVAFPFVL